MASQKKPLVLAVPVPATGHLNPFLHLLRRLADAGFRAALVTSAKSCGEQSSGVEVVHLPDGLTEGEHPRTVREAIERLLDSVNGMKPVSSPILSSPGLTTSLPARSTGDKLIDFIPGIPPASPEEIVHQSFSEEHPFIDYAIQSFERMLQAKWVLSSSFQAIEPDVIRSFQDHLQAKHYVPIGPVISGEHLSGRGSSRVGLSEEDTLCLEWLDAREPDSVLYVSYGSLAILSAEQLMELTTGLEASQQDFLLAMRPSLIVDKFPEEEFNSFQERTKSRGRVVSWCPQLQVLTHPTVGAYLTHCGWNSTMEGICAGVPMIAWPCLAEQNMNCKILVHHGLALTFRNVKQLVGKAEIEETVRAAMTGEQGKQVRRNVEALKGEMMKAVSQGGSSSRYFEMFCQDMMATASI